MSSILDSEEAFRKGYKRAGIKTLREFMETAGLADDFDIDSMSKPELIQVIESYMGYAKGGDVTKKAMTKKAKSGLIDYRKTGMFR